jgi:hypothetical protein
MEHYFGKPESKLLFERRFETNTNQGDQKLDEQNEDRVQHRHAGFLCKSTHQRNCPV